ncbi:MAG: hypothetical protein KA712_19775 [Myxococcales bacterium]|nr:hypothetical protein [Myxococcales bacterium]
MTSARGMGTSGTGRRVHAARGGAGELFLGIDGGGSKTLALLADRRGRTVGRGEAGSSNHHVGGWTKAWAAVAGAVAEARKEAGLPSLAVSALCLGMAGADTAADHRRISAWLHRQAYAQRTRVVNDGALLLAAAGREAGVAVVSGTGSIAWACNEEGQQARAGGWGHLIGDEGSGYHLSIEALRLTVRAADGREAWGPLAQAVMQHLGVRSTDELLAHVYAPQTAKAELAQLSPVVFRLARQGDLQARRLVQAGAHALAELITAVCQTLKMNRPALAFGGSLLARQPALRKDVVARLPFRPASVAVVTEPVKGAVYLARRLTERAA